MKERWITKRGVIIVSLLLILLVLGAIYYFFYGNYKKCGSDSCFSDALAKCDKVSYQKDDGTEILQYKILGSDEFTCSVNMQVLQVKTGTTELGILEGKQMTCAIPLGSITDPARNLENCHGLLKEEIQNIMIQRLHSQIMQNLDQIKLEQNKTSLV